MSTSIDASPLKGNCRSSHLANSSPIHAATPQTSQQAIISMEDDEISDQETVKKLFIFIILILLFNIIFL